jgi:hypothetical protein
VQVQLGQEQLLVVQVVLPFGISLGTRAGPFDRAVPPPVRIKPEVQDLVLVLAQMSVQERPSVLVVPSLPSTPRTQEYMLDRVLPALVRKRLQVQDLFPQAGVLSELVLELVVVPSLPLTPRTQEYRSYRVVPAPFGMQLEVQDLVEAPSELVPVLVVLAVVPSLPSLR